MGSYDLGDVAALAVTVTNTSGVAADATTVSCVVTLPDLTTASSSVTRTGTGSYQTSYTPSQVGRHQIRWVATGDNASAFTDVFTVRDNTRLPIVGLSELKTHLNITATTDDEELRDLLDAATAAAENYCNRALTRRVVTDTLDGGDSAVELSTNVALSVTSVTENGATVSASGYRLDNGCILVRLVNSAVSQWWTGASNIVVTYVVGVTGSDEYAARRGVLEIARHMWKTQRGSMNIGSNDQWNPGEGFSIPNRAEQLLAPLMVVASA